MMGLRSKPKIVEYSSSSEEEGSVPKNVSFQEKVESEASAVEAATFETKVNPFIETSLKGRKKDAMTRDRRQERRRPRNTTTVMASDNKPVFGATMNINKAFQPLFGTSATQAVPYPIHVADATGTMPNASFSTINSQAEKPPCSLDGLTFAFDHALNIKSNGNKSTATADGFHMGSMNGEKKEKKLTPLKKERSYGRRRMATPHRDVYGKNQSTSPPAEPHAEPETKPLSGAFLFTAPKASAQGFPSFEPAQDQHILFNFSQTASSTINDNARTFQTEQSFQEKGPSSNGTKNSFDFNYKPTSAGSKNAKKSGFGRRRRLATPHKDVHNAQVSFNPIFSPMNLRKEFSTAQAQVPLANSSGGPFSSQPPNVFHPKVHGQYPQKEQTQPTAQKSFPFLHDASLHPQNEKNAFPLKTSNLNNCFAGISLQVPIKDEAKPDSATFASMFSKLDISSQSRPADHSFTAESRQVPKGVAPPPPPVATPKFTFDFAKPFNMSFHKSATPLNPLSDKPPESLKKMNLNQAFDATNAPRNPTPPANVPGCFSIGTTNDATGKGALGKKSRPRQVLASQVPPKENSLPSQQAKDPIDEDSSTIPKAKIEGTRMCEHHTWTTPFSFAKGLERTCRECHTSFGTAFQEIDLCASCSILSNKCPVKGCLETLSKPKSGFQRRFVQAKKPVRPPPPLSSNWAKYKGIAAEYYERKEYDLAITWYTKAIEGVGDHNHGEKAKLYGNRAAASLMLKDIKSTLQDCAMANQLDPLYVRAHLRAGRAFTLLGNIDDALKEYDKVCSLLKENPKTFDIKAQLEEATAAKTSLNSLEVINQELKWCWDVGDHNGALALVEQALGVAKYSKSFRTQKVKCLVLLGKYDVAITYCKELLQGVSISDSSLVSILGVEISVLFAKLLHYQLKEDDALKVLALVGEMAPSNVQAIELSLCWSDMVKYNRLGNDAFRAKNYSYAHQLYSTALRLDPDHKDFVAKMYCNRAATSMAMENYKEALSDCDEALMRNSNYFKARLHRARCCVELKKFDEAVRDFDRYLKENPGNFGVRSERDDAREQQKLKNRRSSAHSSSSSRSGNDENHRQHAWDDGYFSSQKSHSGSSQKKQHGSGRKRRTPTNHKKTERNHYEVLGVAINASSSEIKKAYHKLALKHHPDKAKDTTFDALFKDMTAAYTILSDPVQKADYDRTLRFSSYGVYNEF